MTNGISSQRCADLLVLVGPSGSGKSTMITQLLGMYPDLFGYSISHTTRAPREGETNGTSYHFVKPEEFIKLREEGAFVEHAEVHQDMYGTSEASIRHVLSQGKMCVMDLDIQGALAVSKHPSLKTVCVFLRTPRYEDLETRLRERGTETEERLQRRLKSAVKELQWHEENKAFFDLNLVNDSRSQCYQDFHDTVMEKGFGVVPHSR